jgi:hypothetical protein
VVQEFELADEVLVESGNAAVAGLAVEAVMGVGDGPEDGLGGGVVEGDGGAVGLVLVEVEDDVGGLSGVAQVVVLPFGEG